MIKSELGRFLEERNYEISDSDPDKRVSKSVNYDGPLYVEDGSEEVANVEIFESPTSPVLSFPDYKKEKSFSYGLRPQLPTLVPDKQQLQEIPHRYRDKNSEKSFMDRSDISAEDNHLVASYPLPDVRPQKILDLIPQEQRATHPVEVEEITYEEYLELSKRGETFEEPLDDSDEYFEMFDDNVGFDSHKNAVRIKFDDPFDSSLARPRASRRNDLDEVVMYDQNGQYIEPSQLLSAHQQMQLPHVIHQPIVLTPSQWEDGEKLASSGTPGSSLETPSERVLGDVLQDSGSFDSGNTRRMDIGIEEYEYIEESPENEIDASASIEEEENPDIGNEAMEEELEEEEPKIELIEESEFIKPSPVYIVYPDRNVSSTPSPTTTRPALTETTDSTKLFDIEYDQFL